MRDYRPKSNRAIKARAFQSGIEGFRRLLVEVFTTIGRAELSGFTALQIVDNCATKVSRETSA
jgi:hypothetical protein